MKRRATTTIVQPLGATERGAGRPLRQPNDRDESSSHAARADELAPVQRDPMARAARDAASGRVDTDCRGQPASAGGPCASPPADVVEGVPAGPGGRRLADGENRRSASHDPGPPAPPPDGTGAR